MKRECWYGVFRLLTQTCLGWEQKELPAMKQRTGLGRAENWRFMLHPFPHVNTWLPVVLESAGLPVCHLGRPFRTYRPAKLHKTLTIFRKHLLWSQCPYLLCKINFMFFMQNYCKSYTLAWLWTLVKSNTCLYSSSSSVTTIVKLIQPLSYFVN